MYSILRTLPNTAIDQDTLAVASILTFHRRCRTADDNQHKAKVDKRTPISVNVRFIETAIVKWVFVKGMTVKAAVEFNALS